MNQEIIRLRFWLLAVAYYLISVISSQKAICNWFTIAFFQTQPTNLKMLIIKSVMSLSIKVLHKHKQHNKKCSWKTEHLLQHMFIRHKHFCQYYGYQLDKTTRVGWTLFAPFILSQCTIETDCQKRDYYYPQIWHILVYQL